MSPRTGSPTPARTRGSGGSARSSPPAVARSARAEEVVAAARRLLEAEGAEALPSETGRAGGPQAPSLYKHLPDKTALEAAIIATGLEEAAATFETALDGAAAAGAGAALPALAVAYREFALAHPHLYRLMHNGPLPRQHLPAGVEDRAAAPLLQAAGTRARAGRVGVRPRHGHARADQRSRRRRLDAAWRPGISAFQTG